jgi:hypothetical protein
MVFSKLIWYKLEAGISHNVEHCDEDEIIN